MDDETTPPTDKPDPQAFYVSVFEAVQAESRRHPLTTDMDVISALSTMLGVILGYGHPAFHQVMRARVFKCIEEAMANVVLVNSEPAGSA